MAAELGLPEDTEVIAVGSHDTASALFAVPFPKGRASRCAFLSSGTWSLLGVELEQPVLTEEARLAGFTNEGCVGGRIKFLQNITGLWILQRLMKQWEAQGKDVSYDTLLGAAAKSGIQSLIDVDDSRFANPADMQQAIADYCRETDQPVPETEGDHVMCVLRSLAARYKKGIDGLNALLPEPVEQCPSCPARWRPPPWATSWCRPSPPGKSKTNVKSNSSTERHEKDKVIHPA